MFKYYLILLLFVLSVSCESPWDIDTPRKIILPKPVDSVPLSLVSVYVESNGTAGQFVIEKAMLEIDTVSKTALVWGTVSFYSNDNVNYNSAKLCLSTINLSLKNLTVAGNSVTLNSSSTPDSYAEYKIIRGINSSYDTMIVCDALKNKADITFSLDRSNKELWLYLDANIYDKRFNLDNGNSGNVISIPDSLFVKTRLHFTY